MRHEPVALGDATQIGVDLGPGRKLARPVGIEVEREGIEVRGHIALDPGVGVVAPGPAKLVGLFQDDEIVVHDALEMHAGTNAGHAGADDRGLYALHGEAQWAWPSETDHPPSTGMAMPVTNEAAGLSTKGTAAACSFP